VAAFAVVDGLKPWRHANKVQGQTVRVAGKRRRLEWGWRGMETPSEMETALKVTGKRRRLECGWRGMETPSAMETAMK
jgi:hypothetical protein